MNTRDFERDILDAAAFDGTRKASRFSWSYARETLFRKCKRACFIRYYLAQGGWDPYAHPLIRSAYVEKYRLPFRLWLARTFHLALQNGFRKAAAVPQEKRERMFSGVCLRYLGKSVSDLQFSLENREYVDDPKKPAITEFLCAEDRTGALIQLKQTAVDSFSAAYAAFTKSSVFQNILALDFTDLRLEDPFLSFQFEQWPVWFAPGIVWHEKRKFHMLLCDVPGERGKEDIAPRVTAALFQLFVRSKWNNCRGATASAFIFQEGAGDFVPLDPYPDIRNIIRKSSAEMLALVHEDSLVDYRDFPCTEDSANCKTCQFAGTCKALQQWEQQQQ